MVVAGVSGSDLERTPEGRVGERSRPLPLWWNVPEETACAEALRAVGLGVNSMARSVRLQAG